MKKQDTGIFNYNIAYAYADNSMEVINPDFFVFNIDRTKVVPILSKPLRADHFAFVLVTAGEVKVSLSLIDYTLTKSSLFIIPPFLVHEFLGKSENAAFTVMVFSHKFLNNSGIACKHVDAFTFLASQNKPPVMLSTEDRETLLSLMMLLKKKNVTTGEHPFTHDIVQYGFNIFMMELAAIFQRQQSYVKKNLNRKEDLLMSFIKLLIQYFKAERSVQFYADALFITPKHLTKTLKEVTGRTCGDFIDEMVITEAKILLNNLNFSVGNVANELHFSDQFFFSKFFKQHTGLSPTEYKSST